MAAVPPAGGAADPDPVQLEQQRKQQVFDALAQNLRGANVGDHFHVPDDIRYAASLENSGGDLAQALTRAAGRTIEIEIDMFTWGVNAIVTD